jgi:hypothetical protein
MKISSSISTGKESKDHRPTMLGKLAPVQESLQGVIVYGHEGEIDVLQI